MGIVINASDLGADLMLFGNKNQIVSNYVQNQLQRIGPVYNEFAGRMQQALQTSYDFLTNKLVQYGIAAELVNQGVQIANNYYAELKSFSDLQNATPVMQRWVMSHPGVRDLYINQDLDGYSSDYVNVFGNSVGQDDYNYRRVMDSVIVDTDDSFVYRNYLEDLIPGDRELERIEKMAILNTYDAMDWLLSNCKFDFTVKTDGVKMNK